MDKNLWKPIVFAIFATYVFGIMFSMINQHLDQSPEVADKTVVVRKYTRYNPIPISVLEVRGSDGEICKVDVLKSRSDQLSVGAALDIVKKQGFLGKPWCQDQAFYAKLKKNRLTQAVVNLSLGLLFMISWLRGAMKQKSGLFRLIGLASLALSLTLGFATFRLS